jgi:mevalonate kinase
VILLGEHFVVHGEPAVVLAIDQRATVTAEPRKDKKICIKSKAMKCSGYFENDRFYSKKGDLETLGEMMNINHALLCAVGVSNEPIDKMVYAAREAGALGAKLTGGGGGGCIVAISKPERVHDVSEAIKQAGGEAFVTKMTMEGVRIEE